MSRRTKLCITAIFLVLLTVPAVYVALTWTVESPFRFRYLGQGEPEMVRFDEGPFGTTEHLMVPLHLEVKNTSSVTIDLNAILLSKEAGQDSQMVSVLRDLQELPAHSVIRIQCHTTPELARSLAGKELLMHCNWITAPKKCVLDNLARVARWLDFIFEYRMSLPSWHSENYPVEDTSSSSPAPAPSSSQPSP